MNYFVTLLQNYIKDEDKARNRRELVAKIHADAT